MKGESGKRESAFASTAAQSYGGRRKLPPTPKRYGGRDGGQERKLGGRRRTGAERGEPPMDANGRQWTPMDANGRQWTRAGRYSILSAAPPGLSGGCSRGALEVEAGKFAGGSSYRGVPALQAFHIIAARLPGPPLAGRATAQAFTCRAFSPRRGRKTAGSDLTPHRICHHLPKARKQPIVAS